MSNTPPDPSVTRHGTPLVSGSVLEKECPDEWTDEDAHILADMEANAAQLNCELALFLVAANVRECGLTDDIKTKMDAYLEVLAPKRAAIYGLRKRRELIAQRERELEQQERQRALAVEQERERALERERRRNARWRRASRWVRDRFRGSARRSAASSGLDDLAGAKPARITK